MSPSPSFYRYCHAGEKNSNLYACLEKALKIYILPGGCKSMIRPASGNKFLLLSYFCWSLQHNKQFNQLSYMRMLQIFAFQHYLSSIFLIKIGIYDVPTQNCRAKHPGPMTAQIQLLALQPKLWSLPLVLETCISPSDRKSMLLLPYPKQIWREMHFIIVNKTA